MEGEPGPGNNNGNNAGEKNESTSKRDDLSRATMIFKLAMRRLQQRENPPSFTLLNPQNLKHPFITDEEIDRNVEILKEIISEREESPNVKEDGEGKGKIVNNNNVGNEAEPLPGDGQILKRGSSQTNQDPIEVIDLTIDNGDEYEEDDDYEYTEEDYEAMEHDLDDMARTYENIKDEDLEDEVIEDKCEDTDDIEYLGCVLTQDYDGLRVRIDDKNGVTLTRACEELGGAEVLAVDNAINVPKDKEVQQGRSIPEQKEITKFLQEKSVPEENEVRLEGGAGRNKTRRHVFARTDFDAGTFHSTGPLSRINQPYDRFDLKGARDKFDDEVYSLLRDFFTCALTSLVYKIGLQPKQAFQMQEHIYFGDVQVFRDEDSRKYVGGVSENIVHFIRKGALDGAVFHFNMLNREHCPITQQRFAFQSVGSFSAENFDIADTARMLKINELMKTKLSHSLKTISEHPLEEAKCPWFSQWNISIGIKHRFMDLLRLNKIQDLEAPFIGNPSNDYFPFKKRARLSQAAKNGYYRKVPKNPDGSIPTSAVKNIIEKLRSKEFASLKALKEKAIFEFNDLPKLPEWEFFSSSDESEDQERSSNQSAKPKEMQFTTPITSDEVLPNLIIKVYRVDYADTVEVDEAMMARAASEQHAHEELFGFSSDSD